MKRSEINAIIEDALAFCDSRNFLLPPFSRWSLKDWEDKGHEYDEIRENMLGWDITDFGSGDFKKIGLLMFTIRNGNFTNPKYPKPYCEKLLITDVEQVTPYHFHWSKMEDIINRGGGDLMVQLFNHDPENEGAFLSTPVRVTMDGHAIEVAAGTILRVTPGESVTFTSGLYHQFWAEKGKCLIGEVSKVNDDRVDNRFLVDLGRFPAIEEDVAPTHLLYMDYPGFHDVK